MAAVASGPLAMAFGWAGIGTDCSSRWGFGGPAFALGVPLTVGRAVAFLAGCAVGGDGDGDVAPDRPEARADQRANFRPGIPGIPTAVVTISWLRAAECSASVSVSR